MNEIIDTRPAERKAHHAHIEVLTRNYDGATVEWVATNGSGGISIGMRDRAELDGVRANMTPDEARRVAADLIARADEIDANARELVEPPAPAASPELPEGWAIVSLMHDNCEECTRLAPVAVAHAKVTGSSGATYGVAGGPVGLHEAKVERETEVQR